MNQILNSKLFFLCSTLYRSSCPRRCAGSTDARSLYRSGSVLAVSPWRRRIHCCELNGPELQLLSPLLHYQSPQLQPEPQHHRRSVERGRNQWPFKPRGPSDLYKLLTLECTHEKPHIHINIELCSWLSSSLNHFQSHVLLTRYGLRRWPQGTAPSCGQRFRGWITTSPMWRATMA